MSQINFFNEDIKFELSDRRGLRAWFRSTILEEGRKFEAINIILCSDTFLHELNFNHLGHDSLTDILTFPLERNSRDVSGDIYISIERVSENAEIFKQKMRKELNRVMIHGILHLCGYKDGTKMEKEGMRTKEDYYLDKRTGSLENIGGNRA